MLKNHRNIRFALRAAVLMVLASLALAPGLARNHAGLAELLGDIVPTLQAPVVTLAPPVLSTAPEDFLMPPPAHPDYDISATPTAVDAGKPARQTSGAIAMLPTETRPTFAARSSNPGFGSHPGIARSGGGGSAAAPEKSVALAQQTFAPAERGDHSNPEAADDTDETNATAPAETAGNPSLADNDFQDRDSDESGDEGSAPPDLSDDALWTGDIPAGEQRPVVEVPEPSGLALLAIGLLCLAMCRHLPR